MTKVTLWIVTALTLTVLNASASIKAFKAVQAEQLYDKYVQEIKYGVSDYESLSLIDNKIYVDALWDVAMDDTSIDIQQAMRGINLDSDRDTAKMFVLAHYKRDYVTARKYYAILLEKIENETLKSAGLYILWAYKTDLEEVYKTLYSKAKENYFDEYHYFMIVNKFLPKSIEEISVMVKDTPTLTSKQMLEYNNTPRLFLFCRHNRDFPCRFVMKRNDGEYFKHGKDIWTIPALAHGRGDIKFHTTNGYTPQGIHSMDSVMPEANRQRAFGQFRRVILNFLPKTTENTYENEALPGDAKFSTWWHEANVAREVERTSLRIHGTGRINDEPETPYYPHITSSGCITVREGQYGKNIYKDQRILLDALMRASDLDAVFDNETGIKGLLYVVEIDDENRAVTREDLKKYGI